MVVSLTNKNDEKLVMKCSRMQPTSAETGSLVLSVGITTRNRPATFSRALSSVLDQTRLPDEVLVVDDASDHSYAEELVEELEQFNIRVFRHYRKLGLAAGRNRIIAEASGTHLAFLDDDDWWPPNYLFSLSEPFRSDATAGVAIGLPEWQKGPCLRKLSGTVSVRDLIVEGLTPPPSSQMYKLSLLRSIDGYCEDIASGVDHDLWIRLLMPNPVVSIQWGCQAIVNVNARASRMTTRTEERETGLLRSLELWNPVLVKKLGEGFYEFFRASLMARVREGFFYNAVSLREWERAISVLHSHPKTIILVFVRVSRRIIGRKACGTLRPYRGKVSTREDSNDC